jgi:uncharacterized protein involved in cysteine biosynthesis
VTAPSRLRRLGSSFLRGASAPFRGLAFSLRHPRLLLWAAIPVALVAILAMILAAAGWAAGAGLAPGFEEAWAGWIDWLRGTVRFLCGAGLRLAGAAAGVLLALSLAGAVAAPFHDLLSEKAEEDLRGTPAESRPWSAFLGDAARGSVAALVILAFQVVVLAPLFLLSFTAVGAPIFGAACAWFAGLSAADVVLGRRRMPGRERVRWAWRRWGWLLGLGTPLAFVPPLLPFAVVGATLEIVAEEGTGGP